MSDLKFVGKSRQFELVIDEPEGLGGQDEAANSVEYILTRFAGCLNVVGQLVAKKLGITIHKLGIETSGNLNPNRFLGSSKEERAGFKNIHLKFNVDVDANEATLNKWLQIVKDRCPVSDSLSNTTPIAISINN